MSIFPNMLKYSYKLLQHEFVYLTKINPKECQREADMGVVF